MDSYKENSIFKSTKDSLTEDLFSSQVSFFEPNLSQFNHPESVGSGISSDLSQLSELEFNNFEAIGNPFLGFTDFSVSQLNSENPFLENIVVGDSQVPDLLTNPGNSLIPQENLSRDIIFIDEGVENYQQIVNDVNSGAQIFILDKNKDGIEQISEVLRGRENITGVHIVSHGNQAQVNLGTTLLSDDNLGKYIKEIQGWGSALTDNADILIYGCNIAAGEEGKQFIDKLAQLTGADVAASDDLTGLPSLGGDWDLEYSTGSIEVSSFESNYDGILITSTTIQDIHTLWQNNQVPALLDDYQITLDDNSILTGNFTVNVLSSDLLKITGTDISSFVGTGRDTAIVSDDKGLSVNNGSLDFTLNSDLTFNYSLSGQATVNNIDGLDFSINNGTVSGDNTGNTTVNLSDVKLGLNDLVEIDADSLEYKVIKTGTEEQFSFTGQDLSLFTGYGASTTDINDDVGLLLSDADFDLKFNSDDSYSYDIQNASVAVSGVEGLTLAADSVGVTGDSTGNTTVNLNQAKFGLDGLEVEADSLEFKLTKTATDEQVSFTGKGSIFTGYGASTTDTSDDLGLVLSDVDFDFQLNSDSSYSYQVENGSVAVRGIEGLTVEADSVGASGDSTGNTTVNLSKAKFGLDGLIQVEADSLDYKFTKTDSEEQVSFSGKDLSVFTGYGASTTDTSDDIGLVLSNAEFDLEFNADESYSYDVKNAEIDIRGIDGVNVSADAVNFSGDDTGNDVIVDLKNVELGVDNLINFTGSSLEFTTQGAGNNQTINFNGKGLSAKTGYGVDTEDTSDDIGLNISNADFDLKVNSDNTYEYNLENASAEVVGIPDLTLDVAAINASGNQDNTKINLVNADLSLGNLFQVKGGVLGFNVEKTQTGQIVKVTGEDVSAFAGYGINTPDTDDDIGFNLENAEFSVEIKDNRSFSYSVTNADATVNIPGIDISAQQVNATGDNNNLTFNTGAFDFALGETFRASGDDLDFSFEEGKPITIIGSNVSGLTGYGTKTSDTSDDIGLSISNADFSLTWNNDDTYDYELNNANANLVGIPGLTLAAQGIKLVGDETTAKVTTAGFNLGIDNVGYVNGTGLSFNPGDNNNPLTIAAIGVNTFVGTQGGTDEEAGVKLEGGNFGLVVNSDNKYALIADGESSVVGVDGLNFDGSLALRINETGTTVTETIELSNGNNFDINFGVGQENQLRVEGNIDANVGDSVGFGGDFSMELFTQTTSGITTTKLLGGITNGYSFVGSDFKGNNETGVKVENTNLGLVLSQTIDSSQSNQGKMTYALSGEGTGELVNIPGIDLNGQLSVNLNRTGETVDETITTPGGEVKVKFDQADDITQVSGSNISAFVGIGTDTTDTNDDIGIGLKNSSFDFSLNADDSYNYEVNGDVEVVGIDLFDLSGKAVAKGDNNNNVSVELEDLNLGISDFVRVKGDFSFSASEENNTQIINLAASNASGFFGIGAKTDNVELKGEANFDVKDLEVAAQLGFLGLKAGGAGTDSGVNLSASIETGLNGRQSFTDLISGSLRDNFYFDFNGDGYAKLKGLEVDAGFGGITISDDVELGVYLPNIKDITGIQTVTQPLGQAFDLQAQLNTGALQNKGTVIVLPDISELLSLKNLSFENIISGIRAGIDFLDNTLAGQPFYTTPIPVIDRSLQDTFNFLDDITAQIEAIAENPAGVLQEVESLIESQLGIVDDNNLNPLDQKFSLYLDDNFFNIHLNWEKLFQDEFGFAFNLRDFPGAEALNDISSLVDLNGGSKLTLDAIAKLNFDVAISLDSLKQGNAEVVLLDYDNTTNKGTHAEIGARVEGKDLELGFNLGPINFGTRNGTVLIDGDGDINTKDYAGLFVAVDQKPSSTQIPDDGYFYITGDKKESFGDNLQVELNGGFDVNLPIYLDVAGISKDLDALTIKTNKEAYGDQALLQLFKHLANSPDKGTANPVIISTPDIKEAFNLFGGDFSILGILNDPSAILDGVDMSLSVLENTLDSNLAQNIPLLGDKLGRAASFLRDIRQGVLADLRKKLEGEGKAIEILQEVLWDVLGPSQLNLLLDNNGDNQITIDDIGIAWFDIDGKLLKEWEVGGDLPGNADAIQFDVKLGGTIFGTGLDLPLDFELPGFSLDVDGGLGLYMDWGFDFGFGISVSDTFYLTTNTDDKDKELELNISAFLDGDTETVTPPEDAEEFNANGKLLFLEANLKDNKPNNKASGIYGGLSLDVVGDNRGRLTFDRVISGNFKDLFKVDFGLDADLSLETTLSLAGAEGLPKLRGDLEFNWDWKVGEELTSPEVGIKDLEVDLGSYVEDFLKPIAEKVNETLEPIMPLVRALNTEVPGLDIVTSDDTLKGLINLILQIKGREPINWAFIDEAEQIYNLAGNIANLEPDGWLPLGDITGLGTSNPTATQTTLNQDDIEGFKEIDESLDKNTRRTSITTGTSATPRQGFEVLSHLKDISNWMNLLTGGDATLFTYELPLLEFTAELKVLLFSFGIPGIASIDINAIARLSAIADLGFGYDTFGIRQAINTGNPLYALDGFFVSDWDLQTGEEKDEFKFKGSIGLGGDLNIGIASIGAEGLISVNVGVDLQDIEKSILTKDADGFVTDVVWKGDGKIRGSEIATMLTFPDGFSLSNLQNLFNIDGSINFELNLVGSVGVGPFKASFSENLLDFELYKFQFDAPKVQPFLAEVNNGILTLNSGINAGKRKFGNTEDGGEAFYLYTDKSNGEVGVEFDGYYQTFSGVNKIIAYGGEGDDTFDASRLLGVEVEFYGEAGNDKLIAGDAGGILIGGTGNDNLDTSFSTQSITSSTWNGNETLRKKLQNSNIAAAPTLLAANNTSNQITGNQLIGGDGDDTLKGGISTDILDGGDGNDNLQGGDGKDFLDGGKGTDSVSGDGGDDELVMDNNFGNDRWNESDPGSVLDFSNVTDNLDISINSFNITIKKIDENGEIIEGEQEVKINRSADTPLNIKLGTGNDIVNVSRRSIRQDLVIDGAVGEDQLIIEDAGTIIGELDATTIIGLGMGGTIEYANIEELLIRLGSRNDKFTINNTHQNQSTLNTGGGSDEVTVETTLGTTFINTETENDIVTVKNTQAETFIDTGEHDDKVDVYKINATTTITSGTGEDVVNVGNPSNLVDEISARLIVSGNSELQETDPEKRDTLNVNDFDDTKDNQGVLTSNLITGLGMKGQIEYDTFEELNILMGSGNDVMDIKSTHQERTFVDTAIGNDVVNVENISGETSVKMGIGDDLINIHNTNQQVDDISGSLITSGGSGNDKILVDDSGDTTDNLAIVQDTLIRGLGMDGEINYGSFEELDLKLGSRNDILAVESTHQQLTNIDTNQGEDNIRLEKISGTTFVTSNEDNDVVTVSNSKAMLEDIDASLTITGGSGRDIIEVDDSGDTTDNIGILNDNNVRGFGMDAKIDYGSFEEFNLTLGSGNDILTVESTHSGSTNIDTKDGDDNISIEKISGDTTVRGNQGNDNIKVRDRQQLLSNIKSPLALSGGSGNDSLEINNSGDSTGSVAIVNDTTVRGLGMDAEIDYGTFEELNLKLGSGNDIVAVENTHQQKTNIETNDGEDNVKVEKISGETTVKTGIGNDNITVSNSQQTVDNINSELNISGGSGRDNLEIDDSGDTKDNVAIVNDTQINGLGMNGEINYGNIEQFILQLGSGKDIVEVENTHQQKTNIETNDGEDNVKVEKISGETNIKTGSGDDNITVSNSQQKVDNINSELSISGGIGRDNLEIDDSGDTKDNVAILNDTQINGLGMNGKIDYGSFEQLNLELGSGKDILEIENTHQQKTNINTAQGEDSINIQTIKGETEIETGEENDTVNITDFSLLAATLIVDGERKN